VTSLSKSEFLERIVDLLEHGVPDQSGKGWHRDRELCKQGHNNWAMRSSQGKMKRYCVTCNSERKKRK